jgi:ankyrin repeat protein
MEMAYKILMFLTFESTPWDVLSMQCAIAVDLDEDDFGEEDKSPVSMLPFVCKGMVTLDSDSQTIRLVHYSTQEYLLRHSATIFPNGNASIAFTYLHYLAIGPPNLVTSRTETSISWITHPCATRAALLWGEHARFCEMDNNLKDRIIGYLDMEDVRNVCGQRIGLSIEFLDWFNSDVEEVTPLHLASYHGLTKIVQALLERSADISQADSTGRTPLSWAAHRGFQDVVAVLLKYSPSQSSEGVVPLADKEDNGGRTPLMWASHFGSHEVVVALLSRTDVDANREDHRGNNAFHYAASAGHAKIVASLLELAGFDKDLLNKNGNTALIEAAEKGALSVVDVLLKASANSTLRTAEGMTALHVASEHGHVSVVARLLDVAVDINERDNGGRTSLIYAAEKGEAGVVQFLMARGANPNLQDMWKLTALHAAVISGHTNTVAAILGPDLNKITSATRGLSIAGPLRLCHQRSHSLYLDPNVGNDQGCTALHLAAEFGRVDIVSWLLRHLEIDIHALDCEGRTPLARAGENGHITVVNVLIQNRARPYDSAGNSLASIGQWTEENTVRISTIHRIRRDSDPFDPDETIITREGNYETVKKTKRLREDGLPWPSVWKLVGPAANRLERRWTKQRKRVQWPGLATTWEWRYFYVNLYTKEERYVRPGAIETEKDEAELPVQHSNPRKQSMIRIPSSFIDNEYDDRPIDREARSRAVIRETERWMDSMYRAQQRLEAETDRETPGSGDAAPAITNNED